MKISKQQAAFLLTSHQACHSFRRQAYRRFLRLLYCQFACSIICADTRLRRNIQLLGTYTLPKSWLWLADVGIFTRVCDQELALHYPPRSSGQLQKTTTFLHKGMRLVVVHVYWLIVAGWGILFRPICSSFRMRHQPDDTLPSSEQHTQPSNRPVLPYGYGVQSWNVPRFCLLPPIEFRHVYYNVGNGTIHELERRIENSSRNILLRPRWHTWLAICYGIIGPVYIRGDHLCVFEQQGRLH